MFIIIFSIVFILIYSLKKSKITNNTIYVEILNTLIKIISLLVNILKRFKGTSDEKEQCMSDQILEQFRKINYQLEIKVNYVFKGNHGWQYVTNNYTYAITHKQPVKIKVSTFNYREVYAKVIIESNIIVDLIELDTENEVDKNANIFEDSKLANSTEGKKENNDETIVAVDKIEKNETGKSSDSEVEDNKLSKILVLDYLNDNYLTLDNMANDAVSKGLDYFEFKPQIELNEESMKYLAEILVKKYGFRNASILKEGIVNIEIELSIAGEDEYYEDNEEFINNIFGEKLAAMSGSYVLESPDDCFEDRD